MDLRVPDFDHGDGLAGMATDADLQSTSGDASRAQAIALEELADRVNAARSVV